MSVSPGERLRLVHDRLRLEAALESLAANDLLPPRAEDKVAGQLRAGFIASLKASLADGSFQPLAGDVVLVPKQRFASRTASLLGLQERVVFAALVAACAAKIERVLEDADRVFWPRGDVAPNRWAEFEKAPLAETGVTHIVFADVAGFYESVDHARLRRVLIEAVGDTPLADAIVSLLGALMGSGRGLPQGHAASDHLATLYLTAADAAVARAGFLLYRHGDDMRIPVESYPEALRAAHTVEQALRLCSLLPNSSKLAIETRSTYEGNLVKTDDDAQALRDQLQLDAAQKLLDEGADADAYSLLARLGIDVDEPGGYGAEGGRGQVDVEELAELLTTSSEVQAWAMIDDAMQRRPGDAGPDRVLSNEHFHERIAGSLPVLAGAKDARALPFCEVLLAKHVDETDAVVTYLAALGRAESSMVQTICQQQLSATTFQFGWQRAHLWGVLRRTDAASMPSSLCVLADQVALTDSRTWLERAEALKFLAFSGQLTRAAALTLWERAPLVYRADVVAAVAETAREQAWASRFLVTVKQDPVHQVINRNIHGGQST